MIIGTISASKFSVHQKRT